MPFAPVGKLRLRYELRGQGDPVLLVMGLGMSGRGWRRQMADLSQDHLVCCYDNRGVGESSSPPGLYTTRALARDAFGVMDHLGWDRAHVVGISMGGMIAQHMGMMHPERIRSLGLLSTHVGGRLGRPTWAGLKTFARAQTATGQARREHIGDLLFSRRFRDDNHDSLDEAFGDVADVKPSLWGFLGQLAAVSSHMSRRRLHALRDIPTVVLHGTGDILVRPANARVIAEAAQARLIEIPDAGHGLCIEAHEQLNAALRDHFAHA